MKEIHPKRAEPWAFATALVAAAPLLVLWASGHSLAFKDSARLFEPLRPLIVGAIRGGRLPLWIPYEGLGMPLHAQWQHGALHPLSLLCALLPVQGLEPLLVSHVAAGALGAFLLARALGTTPVAAAAAGTGFGLSGYLLGMCGNLPFLAAAGTAPWAAAAMLHAAQGARWGVVATAVSVAALLFAGDPQWCIVAVLLGAALSLETGGWKGLARATAGVVVGALVAGAQLAPTLAFLPETDRAAFGVLGSDRQQWALAPWRLLEIVAPGFFQGQPGADLARVFMKLGGPTTYGSPFSTSVHLGAVMVAMAGLAPWEARRTRVLWGVAALLLWISLGPLLGADQVLRNLPVWGSFRYSEKLVGPLSLVVATLAALGIDRLGALGVAGRRLLLAISVAAGVLAALAGLVVANGDWFLVAWVGEAAAMMRQRLLVGLAHLLLGVSLLAGLLVVMAKEHWRLRAPTVAAILVTTQALLAVPFALHAGTPGVRQGVPLSGYRVPGGVTRVATPTEVGAAYGPAGIDLFDRPIWTGSRMAMSPFGAASGLDQLEPYTAMVPVRLRRVIYSLARDLGARRWIALRRFSVNRVAAYSYPNPRARLDVEAAVEGGRLLAPDTGEGFTIWEVPHRPWAFFAEGVTTARGDEDAWVRLTTLMAEGSPAVVVDAPQAPAVSPGRILAVERGMERLQIEAESSGPALLVVNEAWWPGWKARVDGTPAPILKTDVLVRSVPWPGGRHVLEMRYEPPEVSWGLAISCAGLVVLAGLAAVALRRPVASEAA